MKKDAQNVALVICPIFCLCFVFAFLYECRVCCFCVSFFVNICLCMYRTIDNVNWSIWIELRLINRESTFITVLIYRRQQPQTQKQSRTKRTNEDRNESRNESVCSHVYCAGLPCVTSLCFVLLRVVVFCLLRPYRTKSASALYNASSNFERKYSDSEPQFL